MPTPVVASLADGHGSAIVASLECVVAPDLCAGDDRFRCRTDVDPTRDVCLRGDKPLEEEPFFSRPRGVLIVFGGLLVANLLECILLNHSRTSQYAPVWCAQWSPLAMIGDGKETCGRWSESRARFGLDRRSEPLVPFILDRQREVGWKNLPVLYACKISRLLGFRDWFASWLEGSQRYRQDRILADSMGWMCRRWMRRRNKVMLTELTRCDSPMRRVPGCLSKPLIGSGHVANHDCVVSCRVDDG